ncbi:hypothetical protein JOF56_001798 [Kibdelosporangium banguiense]|uniref:Uncharacterized protein n=1 Tax=Kibdelosporangium banguiense TaxID=1365924 RepID=A0ABS4TC28_9PSEU|nr:hypothetical protein [Kibdelosporangium banguiense]MBP2321413.1 hypothetical protein [Kibdelosporangium banguiense]
MRDDVDDVNDVEINPIDVLGVARELGELEIDEELNRLLERGKTRPTQILEGSELPGPPRVPYARTTVEIVFDDEANLRECVKLLRWSDERLRARPEQLMLWEWQNTIRDRMTIRFGVSWHNKRFFERRKDAFKGPSHAAYLRRFGVTADDLDVRHEIVRD